jgi:DNA-binding transcriptional regulator PaaX
MKMGRVHIGPVAKAILLSVAVAGVVSVAVCAPNALQLLKPFFKKKKYSPKAAIARNLQSLIRTGLLKQSLDTQGQMTLELTKRGRWEAFIRNGIDSGKMKKWDGKWRFVIFDVPNTKSNLRQELTRGMRMYGFKLLQKSVWIYPYPCDDFIAILRDHLELNNNVLYITASSLENDRKFREYFKV